MIPNSNDQKNRCRFLSVEKKYQLFLEAQRGVVAVTKVLRRERLYAFDLARIWQIVKEGAIDRLAVGPGAKKKTVASWQDEALKWNFEEKERTMADLSVEVAILGKKTNGGSWER